MKKNLSEIVALAAIMGILFFTGCDPNAGENDSGSNSGTNGNGSGSNSGTTYTVSFVANGASGTMEAQTFTSGVAQELNRNDFIYDGKFINGWNTLADGSGTSYNECESVKMTGDTTLYAQWKESTSLRYSADSTKGICITGNVPENDTTYSVVVYDYTNGFEVRMAEATRTTSGSTWTEYYPFVNNGKNYYLKINCHDASWNKYYEEKFNVTATCDLDELTVENADDITCKMETGNVLTRSAAPKFTYNNKVVLARTGSVFDIYSGDNYSVWAMEDIRWNTDSNYIITYPLKDIYTLTGWESYSALCSTLEATGKYYSHSRSIVEVEGYGSADHTIQIYMNDYKTISGDWNSDNNTDVSNTTEGVKFSIPVSSAGKYTAYIYDNDNVIQLYAQKEMTTSGNFEVVYPFVKKNTSYNFHIYFMEYVTTKSSGSSEPVFDETLEWTTDETMEDKDVGTLTMSCTSLDSGGVNVKCTQSKDILEFLEDSGYTVSTTWQMNICKQDASGSSLFLGICSYSVSSADQTSLLGSSGLDITESSLGSWTIDNEDYTASSIISLLAGTGWKIFCQFSWGDSDVPLVYYTKSVCFTK